ncbi:MAG: BrnA antitoxin family protein [Alphaproteobacteria bacterium]
MSERNQKREYVEIDGRRYPLPTPEEDARIRAGALADPDNPPLTEEDWARMRPAKKRGRPTKAVPKYLVTIRLDPEIVDVFKAEGPGWQTRINDVLKQAAARARPPSKPAKKSHVGRAGKRRSGRS